MKEGKKIIITLAIGALAITILGIMANRDLLPTFNNRRNNTNEGIHITPETPEEAQGNLRVLRNDWPIATVTINSTILNVVVADTNEAKSLGLGGVKELSDTEGMLFEFEKKTAPVFWMKDMQIPIDIIWIADGKIEKIDHNIQPEIGESDDELTKYNPPKPVNYVLEVRAGLSNEKGFEVGDSVDLSSVHN